MKRREMLKKSALAPVVLASLGAGESKAGKLTPPARGKIRVAFLISRGATVIDFAGPWEVFQDVHVPERGTTMDEIMPFELFTVAETRESIQVSGGMEILPNHTFESAPQPHVVVVPAQGSRSDALLGWLQRISGAADVTTSVCTGAFVLGDAGLLKGHEATTHHHFYDRFAQKFPDVILKRGRRFVEGPKISTAGGLTSGIDLALRIVERYFGREVAQATANYMEYQSTGWIV